MNEKQTQKVRAPIQLTNRWRKSLWTNLCNKFWIAQLNPSTETKPYAALICHNMAMSWIWLGSASIVHYVGPVFGWNQYRQQIRSQTTESQKLMCGIWRPRVVHFSQQLRREGGNGAYLNSLDSHSLRSDISNVASSNFNDDFFPLGKVCFRARGAQ